MFHIIQSNDTKQLVEKLLEFYKAPKHDKDLGQVFRPFRVIVPSMVLGDWLTNQIAIKQGISTLFVAEFWGKYQWQMMSDVLTVDASFYPDEALSVPEVAVLSASIMQWRLFGHLSACVAKDLAGVLDESHPLSFLLSPIVETKEQDGKKIQSIAEHRLWQVCQELSRVYVRYLTHRPLWLSAWAKGQSLQDDVVKMMAKKAQFDAEYVVVRPSDDDGDVVDNETPEWLKAHYLSLERVLSLLWHELFGRTYLYREKLEERFWAVLSGTRHGNKMLAQQAKSALPETLYLFTVQQIPQMELDFLYKLSKHIDVVLLHFNPSAMFWADVVDKDWLLNQRIVNPDKVYLKDYGHALLSRLGKESRETFAMLADMAGIEDVVSHQMIWDDRFIMPPKDSLLNCIKSDILMLSNEVGLGVQMVQSLMSWQELEDLPQKTRPKSVLDFDKTMSISLHACHSLTRQLEVARQMIARYLATPKADGTFAKPSDVVMLLPDVAQAEDLIRAVFPEGRGADGLYLPIKITGTTDKHIDELLVAIAGFYELLGEPNSRFYAEDVYEWLMTPAVFESFGLDYVAMRRGCELLRQAGFKRGFDERHIASTLDDSDRDYRYTFAYALDRIVLGFLSPNAPDELIPQTSLHPFCWQKDAFAEAVLPLAGVGVDDEPIVSALTAIFAGLDANRDKYTQVASVQTWLNDIENQVINRYFGRFGQSVAMRAIFNTKNTMMASLRANQNYYGKKGNHKDEIFLSCRFVLQSLIQATKAQTISAEPSGVITVARFGAVRSIPFGLTVMLDMNLSAFPRQDQIARLDLMKAGLKHRGDRYNEDDDNGAFLDALLCTEKVMIFYQGFGDDGKTKTLPASSVSELLQFLKTDALWQMDDVASHDKDKYQALMTKIMPDLVERYLVTEHSATPFDESLFYESKLTDGVSFVADDDTKDVACYFYEKVTNIKRQQQQNMPPIPLWHQVRQVLDGQALASFMPVSLMEKKLMADLVQTLTHALECCNDDTSEMFFAQLSALMGRLGVVSPTQEHATTVIRHLQNPALAFLSDKVHLPSLQIDDVSELDEPLALDGLGKYQLADKLLESARQGLLDELEGIDDLGATPQLPKALHALYYADSLPAGVVRLTTPTQALKGVLVQFHQLRQTLQNQPPDGVRGEFETMADLPISRVFTPTEEQKITLSDGSLTVVATLPVDRTQWLRVLANRASEKHLLGFWVYHLLWQVARQTDASDVVQGAGGSIWQFGDACYYLPPIKDEQAGCYLAILVCILQVFRNYVVVTNPSIAMTYLDKRTDDGDVFKHSHYEFWHDSQKSHYDDNAYHAYWQFVLGDIRPMLALKAHIGLAYPMFEPMRNHLKSLS